jgi:hypothetical protein
VEHDRAGHIKGELKEAIMRAAFLVIFLAGAVFPGSFADAGEPDKPGFSVPDELIDAWERLQRALQEWGGQLRERFHARGPGEERPIISLMLKYRDYLRLTPEQVKKLEQQRDQFQRQSIRAEADMRILELDIAALTDQPQVELPKVEQKIRELEKARADLRIARVRSIEQAKGVLTSEQRKRFYEALEPRPRASENSASGGEKT